MGVSIIIPYHRGAHFLKDCLESIRDLTLSEQEYEVILVYDKRRSYEEQMVQNLSLPQSAKERINQDEFTELWNAYRNLLPIKCYEMNSKSTIGMLRNYGLEKATKDYIYFMDSDDYLIPGGLEKMVLLSKEHEASVVFGTINITKYKRYTYLLEKQDSYVEDCKTQENDVRNAANVLFAKEVSALNLLIRREWLQEKEICFDENPWYCDLPFVIQLLIKSEKGDAWVWCKEASYAKRLHNDPILYPALSQLKASNRYEQFLQAVTDSKQMICSQQHVLQLLDQYTCQYYVDVYVKSYHGKKNMVLSEELFHRVSLFLQEMDEQILLQFPIQQRRILQAIRENKRKKAVSAANHIIVKKKRKGLFGNTIQRARVLDHLLFRRLPVKDHLIIFESFGGKSYSDSCKYIYEYMQKNYGASYQYVWVMKDKNVKIPGNPIVVQPNTYRYLYYLARAKYLVFNNRQPIWYEKRKDSIFIQTWHGTPLKKLVFDMEDIHSASWTYKEDCYKMSRKWDYLLSDNAFSTEVFQHAFLYDKEKILEYGYPRNDLLYTEDSEDKAIQIKKTLGIPLDKKVILYAPTWRDDEFYDKGKYKFTFQMDFEALKRELSEEYVLLLRTHYFVVDQVDDLCGDGFVYNASRYQDVTELYLISDICITDYSSVFFDYANLKRPILFFTYDLDKYREELRGFYIDMDTEVPGPLLQTNEELLKAIKEIDVIEEQYKERYNRFYERFCSMDDGHAAQRVVENIIRKG